MDVLRYVQLLVQQYETPDPFVLADRLGVRTVQRSLPPSVKGLYVCVQNEPHIILQQGLSSIWRRYVCAHELGHACLHAGTSHYFLLAHTFFALGRYERESDLFAQSLLCTGCVPEEGETQRAFLLRCGIPVGG